MSLANIREKISDAIETIPGLTVSEYIPDTVTLPLACITLNPANPVEYDFTAGNKSWKYHCQIQILVNKGGSVLVAQKELDKFIDPEDDLFIKTPIEDIDLTPDADVCRLVGSPTYGTATYGSTEFLAILLNLDVWCSKQ